MGLLLVLFFGNNLKPINLKYKMAMIKSGKPIKANSKKEKPS